MPPAASGRAIAMPVPNVSIFFSVAVSGVLLTVKARAGCASSAMASVRATRERVSITRQHQDMRGRGKAADRHCTIGWDRGDIFVAVTAYYSQQWLWPRSIVGKKWGLAWRTIYGRA